MNLSNINNNPTASDWSRFCDLLWFDDVLGFWIDISKMNITTQDINNLKPHFEKAFKAMDQLEGGSIANKDEGRQVGHYWLRNFDLAPSKEIALKLSAELSSIQKFADDIRNGSIKSSKNTNFRNILWIGIGGSSLGPILLVNALKSNNNHLNFYFLDNVDPGGISETLDLLDKELDETLVVVVSKSGGTLEPKICMEQARYRIESNGGVWNKQAIAITMNKSKLDLQADREEWLCRFDLPDWVGGRTSITSAVGLLPAAFIQADLLKFLEGASVMDRSTREKKVTNNPAALLAASWFISGSSKGKKDMVILPYKDRLDVLSKYLQQLVMESLGKKYNRCGEVVCQGLSVYGNKGSTDQHAYIQQLRDGLDNFFAVFVEVIKDQSDRLKVDQMNPASYLSGFLQGTRKALTQANKESITISITELNPFTLGALIALFERTVGLYAELIDINAYDQPGVEAGKIAAAEVIKIEKVIQDKLSTGKICSIQELNNHFLTEECETIFWIVRTMYVNNSINIIEGDWSNPVSLKFKYK